MGPGGAQQRAAPVTWAAEVGDDHDERALHREAVDERERIAERAFAGGLLAQRGQREQEAAATLPRAAPLLIVGAERHETEPIAASRRRVTDRERDAFGDVGLATLGGAEVHRRRC